MHKKKSYLPKLRYHLQHLLTIKSEILNLSIMFYLISLFHTELSESVNGEKNEQGTSKFLTMKVANRLLGLMMVESSKGKR